MEFGNFLKLLALKINANLRVEVARYYLNYLWWVIEPLLTMMVLYFVFSFLLHRGTRDFTGFLLVGVTSWHWFARTVLNSSQSILQGKGLMLQVNIHKAFFPLVVVGQDAFKQIFVLCLLLVFLVFYPTPVTMSWFALPVLFFIQLILVASTAMFFAAIVPFLPDLFFIIGSAIRLLFFASGIFYDIEQIILPRHRFLYYLNPMAGLIKNYREILINDHWPDWQYLGMVTLFSMIFFSASLKLISRFNHIYPKICQQ